MLCLTGPVPFQIRPGLRPEEVLRCALAGMLADLALGKLGEKFGKHLLGWLAQKFGIKACFIAGTLVPTPGGAQAIDALASGDVVLAVDEHTGVVSERPVLSVSSREVERYLDLRLESPEGVEAGDRIQADLPIRLVPVGHTLDAQRFLGGLALEDHPPVADAQPVPLGALQALHVP